MDELIESLKIEIISCLNIKHITPEELDIDEPLFGEKVGLDSVDALELIILMQKNYDVTLENPKQGLTVFYSVRSMAEYIHNHINSSSQESTESIGM